MAVRILWIVAILTWLWPIEAAFLPEEIVKLSLQAAELSEALRIEVLPAEYASATIYKDRSYAALFFKDSAHCFVAFDTTTRLDLVDWLRNIDPNVAQVCPFDGHGECCDGRNGFEDAVTEPSYETELNEKVIECHEEDLEIVLTGFSAGGGAAVLAAVVLQMTDPTIITFGQPPSLAGSCPAINEGKYYRFVNTELNRWHNLDYDPVPSLSLTRGAMHMGQLFLMNADDAENVASYENRDPPSIGSWGFDADAHRNSAYLAGLQSYQGKSLGTDGWVSGSACNLNEECASGECSGSPWYWSSGECV